MDHTPHPEPDTPGADVVDDVPLISHETTTSPAPATTAEGDPTPAATPALVVEGDTEEQTIENLSQDVLHCFENKQPVYDTFFYKVVLGGHLSTVKHVIQHMESNDHVKPLSWLLGTGKVKYEMFRPIKKKAQLKVARRVVFMLTSLLCIILSPVFYILHGFSCTVFKQRSQHLTLNIHLPLAFAAFSHSEDMIKFFFSKSVRIENTDRRGNNVFHYIADMSMNSSSAACRAFDTLLGAMTDDLNGLYTLLFKRRNSQGLTALEYVAQYGSAALLTKMMNAEPGLRNVHFAVTDQGVKLATLNRNRSGSESSSSSSAEEMDEMEPKAINSLLSTAPTREECIDVTMYETSMVKRSFLLRLISGRNVSSFSVKDLTLFRKCPVIGKWIQLKIKELRRFVYVVHSLDVIVTIMLLITLMLIQGSTDLNLQTSKKVLRVELEEYSARAGNDSNILHSTALHHLLEKMVTKYQSEWIINKMSISEVVRLTNLSTLDDLDTVSKLVLQQQPQTEEVLAILNIPMLVQRFASSLLEKYPDLPITELTTNNVDSITDKLMTTYKQFDVDIDNITIRPHEIFLYKEWRSFVCLPSNDLSQEHFRKNPLFVPPSDLAVDICMWQMLVTMTEKTCDPETPLQVYEHMADISSTAKNSDVLRKIFVIVLIIVAIVYVFIDILEHLLFFWLCIKENCSIMEMILSLLSWRVPGSYYKKQLNVITFYGIMFNMYSDVLTIGGHSQVQAQKFTHYMLLFGLILRSLMHIHALRLLPWIGHFIVTTFMMATNLIHFSTVLGLVVFIFSVIFHILVVDKDCPVRQYEGYETIGKSMLTVFMLAFGHGDFEQYRSSTPVIVSYVLFVIIVGLLLLNLIIAIMSATATDLMTPEGVDTLHKIEWLFEVLSIEYTVVALAGNICAKRLYNNHVRAGFIVHGSAKKPKISVKVFYCPKLD